VYGISSYFIICCPLGRQIPSQGSRPRTPPHERRFPKSFLFESNYDLFDNQYISLVKYDILNIVSMSENYLHIFDYCEGQLLKVPLRKPFNI